MAAQPRRRAQYNVPAPLPVPRRIGTPARFSVVPAHCPVSERTPQQLQWLAVIMPPGCAHSTPSGLDAIEQCFEVDAPRHVPECPRAETSGKEVALALALALAQQLATTIDLTYPLLASLSKAS